MDRKEQLEIAKKILKQNISDDSRMVLLTQFPELNKLEKKKKEYLF